MHKASRRLGSRQFPPSPCSPGVIVLAPHVYGLVHVALGGRLLARALHHGQGGAGRNPAVATDAEQDTAPSQAAFLPPTLAPPAWAGAAPAAARSAPRGSFPRRSPALRQEQAPATPPARAGPPRPPPALAPPPPLRAPPPRGRRSPRLAGRRGGAALSNVRCEAAPEAWERCAHLGPRSGAPDGRSRCESEREVANSGREWARARARAHRGGRAEEGVQGRALDLEFPHPLLSPVKFLS